MLKGRRVRFAVAVLATAFAMNAALWLATAGLAHPRTFLEQFFGPRMVRAEVVVMERGSPRDYQLDQGRVRAVRVAAGVITLAERDGTVVDIQVAPGARIEVNGSPATLRAIRRGMTAQTVRAGDSPAHIVRAGRVR